MAAPVQRAVRPGPLEEATPLPDLSVDQGHLLRPNRVEDRRLLLGLAIWALGSTRMAAAITTMGMPRTITAATEAIGSILRGTTGCHSTRHSSMDLR